jgi:hypothetical protein
LHRLICSLLCFLACCLPETPSGCGGPESFANHPSIPLPHHGVLRKQREKLAKTTLCLRFCRMGEALTEKLSNQMCRNGRRRPLFSIHSASNPPSSLSQQQHPGGGKEEGRSGVAVTSTVRLRPRPIGCITKSRPNQAPAPATMWSVSGAHRKSLNKAENRVKLLLIGKLRSVTVRGRAGPDSSTRPEVFPRVDSKARSVPGRHCPALSQVLGSDRCRAALRIPGRARFFVRTALQLFRPPLS